MWKRAKKGKTKYIWKNVPKMINAKCCVREKLCHLENRSYIEEKRHHKLKARKGNLKRRQL